MPTRAESAKAKAAKPAKQATPAKAATGKAGKGSTATDETEPTAARTGRARVEDAAAADAPAAPDDGIRWGPVDVLVWVVVMFAVLALLLPVMWLLIGRALGYQLSWPAGSGATAGEIAGRLGVGQPPSLVKTFADVSLELQTAMQIPLWLVMLAGPIVVARRKGHGVVADFKARMEPSDIGIGLVVGVLAQLVLVPVFYKLLFVFTGDQDVSAAARELTDKATSPLGVLFLVIIVGVGAPIAEELFYRGLVLRALGRRWSPTIAIVGSSALFALFHFQPLQFPALMLFGIVLAVLTLRYDRLGPAVWAHVAFNLTSVVLLVGNLDWPPF